MITEKRPARIAILVLPARKVPSHHGRVLLERTATHHSLLCRVRVTALSVMSAPAVNQLSSWISPEPNHLHGQLAHACWASSLTATCCLPQVGQSRRSAGPWSSSVSVPHRSRPAFAHANGSIPANLSERPGHLSPENIAHEVPGPFLCMINFEKKASVYLLFSGTNCDVFKGSTHHGGLGLSLKT